MVKREDKWFIVKIIVNKGVHLVRVRKGLLLGSTKVVQRRRLNFRGQ